MKRGIQSRVRSKNSPRGEGLDCKASSLYPGGVTGRLQSDEPVLLVFVYIMSGVKKKAPKERDMSTIPRGSEALHPVKLNLLFIIGEKSAGMRG